MTIESILITEDTADSKTDLIAKTQEDLNAARVKQETIDFKMVTFCLSGKDYAIDIMYVKEIAKAGQFTFVPNTMPFVIGVYNLRGDIIPIIDMRIFFNAPVPEYKEGELRNLLILKVEEQTFGIVVDKIDKVVGVQKSSIQPPHPLFTDINVKYISGVVEANKRLYILLDIERIFNKSTVEADEKKAVKYPQSAPMMQMSNPVAQISSKEEPKKEQAAQNNSAQTAAKVSAKNEVVEKIAEEASVSEVREEKTPVDNDYQFVLEELKTFGKFNVSEVNEEWVKYRYEEWKKERTGKGVQLQNESDAQEFLKSFWSKHTDGWWSKEYADEVYNILPDNSAKQIVVWNPGCGKGMETYCLACVLAKRYPESKVRLYAQDVDLLNVSNAPMLSIPQEVADGWLSSFVAKTASGSNTFNQQIKDSILFEYHDCQHTNALPMIDVIFARDLLSVINTDAQSSLVKDFDEKIKGNGIIIIGDNEKLSGTSEFGEKTVGSITAYNKQ